MPRRSSSEKPPVMTWGKSLPVLALCAVFDALRAFFEFLGFFGPALAGTATGLWFAQNFGSDVGAAAGTAAAGVTAYLASPELEAVGVVIAEAVGLLGWLITRLILVMTNVRIFGGTIGSALWNLAGLAIAETPFVGSFPSLTTTTFFMYQSQIRKDRALLKAWEADQRQLVQAQQEEQIAALVQARAMEGAQAEDAALAANDTEEVPEEGRSPEHIQNENKLRAANDNREIPEAAREAA